MFLDTLLSIIRVRTRKHFVRIMPMEDYSAINAVVTFEECHGAPFAFTGRAVAAGLLTWKREYVPNDPLLMIFEDGTEHKGDLEEVFKRDKLRTPLFQSKKEVNPLQAADLLAWECFNAYKIGHVRDSFRKLLRLPFDHGLFDLNELVRRCEEDKTPGRLAVPPDFEVVFHSSPKRVRRRTVKREPNPDGIWGYTRKLKDEDDEPNGENKE